MKKIYLLLLLFLGIGIMSVSAQDAFYLRFYTNTGGDPTAVSYLYDNGGTVSFQTTRTGNGRTWTFEPVGGSDPGWYYIKNTYTNRYLLASGGANGGTTNANLTTATSITTGTSAWRAKFRLIKTNSAASGTPTEKTARRFKISARYNTTDYVIYRRTNNNNNLRMSTSFTTDRGVVELIPVEDAYVFNSGQELVSTYDMVSPSTGTGTGTNYPAAPPTTSFYDFSGNDAAYPTESTVYTNLFPIGYQREETTTRVIHGHLESGGTEEDGYYFSRIPKSKTLNLDVANPSLYVGDIIEISFWARGYRPNSTESTELSLDYSKKASGTGDDTFNATDGFKTIMRNISGRELDDTQVESLMSRLELPSGIVIGKMEAGNTTGNNMTTIPVVVEMIDTEFQDPDAWFFYQMRYTLPNATNANLTATFTNLMNHNYGLMDIDDVEISIIRADRPNYTVIYRTSDETPQNTHEIKQVIYARAGSAHLLRSATENYGYYRWYLRKNLDEPSVITKTNASGVVTQEGDGLTQAQYNSYFSTTTNTNRRLWFPGGVVYTTQNWSNGVSGSIGTTGGNQMNINPPALNTSGKWNTPDNKFIVAVDASNYSNYNYDEIGLKEPTLSWRNIFEFRPAWEIAKTINDTLTTYNEVLEYIELDAPTNHRLRLTPQYTFSNYWMSAASPVTHTSTLVPGTRFHWVRLDNGDQGEKNSNGSSLPNTDDGLIQTQNNYYYFPRHNTSAPEGTQRYLQINTTGKTDGQVEYFDCYVSNGTLSNTTTGSPTITRKIARFKVTYRDIDNVGPTSPVSGDLLSGMTRRKLIKELNFDQMAAGPNLDTWDESMNTPLVLTAERDETDQQPYSYGGFGLYRLGFDETSFGFVDMRSYTDPKGNPSGAGYHLNDAKGGYWSEYSFPQSINGQTTTPDITTNNLGWSTAYTVYDRTNIAEGGTVSSPAPNGKLGNMMYVDASQYPGVFATLDISESVCPGTELYFSAWIVNLNTGSTSTGIYETGAGYNAAVSTVRPNLVLVLKDLKTGKEVKRFYTGDIGINNPGVWRQVAFSFQIGDEYLATNGDNEDGFGEINFRLEIHNNGLGTTGNDFAMDNIQIYRTNPSVIATRINATYCAPDTGEVVDESPLNMQVEVDIDNLMVWQTGRDKEGYTGEYEEESKWKGNTILYFRMLDQDLSSFEGDYRGFDYKPEGNSDCRYTDCEDPGLSISATGIALPTNTDDATSGVNIIDHMYPNMKLYKITSDVGDNEIGYYYYGSLDLNNFTWDNTETEKIGDTNYPVYRYTYYVRGETDDDTQRRDCKLVNTTLTFYQDIPFSILFNEGSQDVDPSWNHGPYHIYVAESSGGLLNATCAGEASFTVQFDETDFTAYIGTSTDGLPVEELQACTNQDVTIVARTRDVNDPETPLFSYYDWYNGPTNTYPETALNYTDYDIIGNYPDEETGDKPVMYENQNIRSDDGYQYWLEESEDGKTWLASDEGQDWNWAPVNYVGYHQYGGRYKYDGTDGTTSATRISDNDNSKANVTGDYRDLKMDMKAFRHFFPYVSKEKLPAANVEHFPIDPFADYKNAPSGVSVDSIDYKTGDYYHFVTASSKYEKIDGSDPSYENYRFTPGSFNYYRTDYAGIRLDADGDPETINSVQNPAFNGAAYYINDLNDLKRLLARIHYYLNTDLIDLYSQSMTTPVETLAPYYITVIPIDVAFYNFGEETDANYPVLNNQDAKAICTTPAQVKMRAAEWGADTWMGEIDMESGLPAMPYFDIDDENFLYTVRLPEKKKVLSGETITEIRETTQFVAPMLYFDEFKRARVRLTKVYDEKGDLKSTPLSDSYIGDVLNNAYIGLINPDDPNKLLRTHYYWIDKRMGDERPLEVPEQLRTYWNLNDERNSERALESYLAVINGYNYYFDEDPLEDNVVVSQEGDPYPVGTKLGRVGRGELNQTEYPQEQNIVSNNNIGLEIFASDVAAVSTNFVKTIDSTPHFKIGYTYVFSLEGTASTEWVSEPSDASCEMSREFRLKVVPDTLYWKSDNSESGKFAAQWNKDGGWYMPREVNGVRVPGIASDTITFAPLPETHVVIPAGMAAYPILENYVNLTDSIRISRSEKEPTHYDTTRKAITMELGQLDDYAIESYFARDPNEVFVTPFIEFDYNYRPNSCDTIHFKHEGDQKANPEVANTYLLNYNAAKVDLNLETSRNYSISAPLRHMYSGDYSFDRINPVVSMQLFNAKNPQNKNDASTTWTDKFNTSNVPLVAGLGYSVNVGVIEYNSSAFKENKDEGLLVAATQPGNEGYYTKITDKTFHFPSDAMSFTYYNLQTKAVTSTGRDKIPTGGRDFAHRFIYEIDEEIVVDETTNNTISVSPITKDNPKTLLTIYPYEISKDKTSYDVVLGNPLMSHFDFEQFYNDNKGLISPQFKILYALKSSEAAKGELYVIYNAAGDGGFENPAITDPAVEGGQNSTQSKYLAPMQSFIITMLEGHPAEGDELYINKEVSKTKVDSRLRSPAQPGGGSFSISAQHGEFKSKAIVAFSESSDNAYKRVEDSHILLPGKSNAVPVVSTIVDEEYLGINRMKDMPERLPIAIFTTSKGNTTIRLNNIHRIEAGDDWLYFLDHVENQKVLLEESEFEYTFNNTEGDLIGRFEILRVPAPTALEEVEKETKVLIYQSGSELYISTNDGSNLNRVELVNINGQSIYRQNKVGDSHLHVTVSETRPAVIIVRTTTDKSSETKKVLMK